MYTPSTLPNSRIDIADILRGLAIAGIIVLHFIEHMNLYLFPENLTPLDGEVWIMAFALFGGKMYGIFATLFGLSFFIQHDNQAQRGNDYRLRFVWRMVLLFFFGMVNIMFYSGDILTTYAAAALLVVPLIRASNKVLWFVFAFLFLQPVELLYIVMALVDPSTQPLSLDYNYYFWALFQPLSEGMVHDMMAAGVKYGLAGTFIFAIENGRMTQTLCLFIFGILLGRYRFFYFEGNNKAVWIRTMAGAVAAYVALCHFRDWLPGKIETGCIAHCTGIIVDKWYNFSIMLMYITGLTLLFHLTRAGKYMKFLAPYGRMSLSNYIGQSMVGATIFYGWGFGLYKTSGHTQSMLIALAVIAAQVVFCRWWLSHHKRGPLEALWRKLTWIGA